MFRIGHGFDVHKFGGVGPCTLGGVKVPYEQGLIAHSDGDVVLHAISDALLRALALGDIGHFYPDNDDRFFNIDSRILLRDVVDKIHSLGLSFFNENNIEDKDLLYKNEYNRLMLKKQILERELFEVNRELELLNQKKQTRKI